MQPYVTGGNTQKKKPSTTNAYGSSTTSSNPYGAPSSTYSGTSGYTSTGNTAASNPYGAYGAPISSTTTTSSSNSYGMPSSNSYGTPSSYNASSGTNTMPPFSQALNNPPPVQAPAPVASSGYGSTYARATTDTSYGNPPAKNPNFAAENSAGGYGSAIAVPSSAVTAMSAVNSSTYSSGPTGGLVSEGNPVKCDKVDYEIKGHEMQIVEIELDPSETVIAEAGAMMYLEENITFEAKFGDGSEPKQGFFKKLMSAGGRLLTGESLFITHFTNKGSGKARVAFAAPYPGTILPINMQALGSNLICQRDAFLCAAKGTKLSIHWNRRIGGGLFGGEGFILQKLQGDGMAFVHAGGMIIRRELRGEKLRIDTGCVMAFTEGINFDVQLVKGLKSMFFGGEGLFLATLQGTGTIWLQSLPFSRFADRVIQHAPSAGGRRQGEGSALTGGFGDLVNGDGFGFNF